MPSPVGHAIAGATVAWVAEAVSDERRDRPPKGGRYALTIACAALAMAPDLDLLAPFQHRTATHSVVAVALVLIMAIGVTGKVTGRVAWAAVIALTAAYASHLFLDWLAEDSLSPRGLQMLWPLSSHWFISEANLFRGTAREDVFTLESLRINALAIAQEIAILGPIAVGAWLVRVKALARLPAQMPGRHHAAQ